MAFKMRRSDMNLGSPMTIQPQLTKLQSQQKESPLQMKGHASPFKQDIVAADYGDTTYAPDGKGGVRGVRESEGSEGKTTGTTYDGNNFASDEEWIKICKDKPCHVDCKKSFPEGCPDTPGDKQEASTSLEVDIPEVQGNMLTPREMRRNTRAADIFRRRQEDLIRRANKDFRQATRRGQSHDPNSMYMKILSGEALGDMDGVNIGQASTGTTNLFTGQKTYKFNPKTGGGKKSMVEELNAELQKEEYKKMDPKESTALAQQRVSDAYISSGKVKVFNEGQHLTSRSRGLADDRNYDTDSYGDFGKEKVSSRKQDSNARKVTGYTDDLMKGVIENQNAKPGEPKYQYDPNNKEGMSKKKYDRLKRKTKKRGGDSSAFKKKGSPMHMTVNVTKPSYKMGGFGSK